MACWYLEFFCIFTGLLTVQKAKSNNCGIEMFFSAEAVRWVKSCWLALGQKHLQKSEGLLVTNNFKPNFMLLLQL